MILSPLGWVNRRMAGWSCQVCEQGCERICQDNVQLTMLQSRLDDGRSIGWGPRETNQMQIYCSQLTTTYTQGQSEQPSAIPAYIGRPNYDPRYEYSNTNMYNIALHVTYPGVLTLANIAPKCHVYILQTGFQTYGSK